jgi:predicted nuclease of restriction endonuclease-like (RecB) superfamily
MSEIINSRNYITFLNDIKRDIQTSRVKAALSINKELILLYWRIGNEILKRKKEQGWGSEIVKVLSQDLKHSFPSIKGFGERNLVYMQTFASEFKDYEFTQQVVAQIPWGHITHLLDKISDQEIRTWYIQKTIENGWSRNVLVMNMEAQTHLKLGAAKTNFAITLPNPTSDLAQQLIKSEYNFEFLGISEDVHEKVIEKGLIEHIRDFLLQLGNGFAFLGNQYKIEVGEEEFFIDLLFYHTQLRCYVVFELKADKFKPEYAGKLGFYITSINKQIKHENDNSTIGVLLCKKANKVVVEYALNDHKQPIGVAEYTMGLPQEYKNLLPTPEEFQHLLDTLEISEITTDIKRKEKI